MNIMLCASLRYVVVMYMVFDDVTYFMNGLSKRTPTEMILKLKSLFSLVPYVKIWPKS